MLLLTISDVAEGATPAEAGEAIPRLVVQLDRATLGEVWAVLTAALTRECGPDDPLLEWEEDDSPPLGG
jgi:hypothetical protein